VNGSFLWKVAAVLQCWQWSRGKIWEIPAHYDEIRY